MEFIQFKHQFIEQIFYGRTSGLSVTQVLPSGPLSDLTTLQQAFALLPEVVDLFLQLLDRRAFLPPGLLLVEVQVYGRKVV